MENISEGLISELTAGQEKKSVIMVVGVGGAGGNAVRYMWNMGIRGVDFMICNTDQQAIEKSPIDNKVQLGAHGLGAGNDPEEGKRAAIESLEAIMERLKSAGTKMLFITAGMGGGTGTGASPVIAKLANEMGILTVAIVTTPLTVEGTVRYSQAMKGIDELKEHVDSLLIINNDNILKLYEKLPLKAAFGKADDILCSAAKGIAEIITVESDLVNVDFADVSRVMRGSGSAHMSVASASGEDRAMKVAENSLTSPLLDHNLISGAKNILLNFSVANEEDLGTDEVKIVLDYIQEHARMTDANGKVTDANIIWGTSVKPNLEDSLELVLVVTGFGAVNAADMLENINKGQIPTAATVGLPPVKKEMNIPVANINRESSKVFDAPIPSVSRSEIVGDRVVLGVRTSRYANIGQLLEQPAYQTRNAQLLSEDCDAVDRTDITELS